jgi:hypothetical protein
MIGMCHHSAFFPLKWGLTNFLCPDWPQTAILPISAFQVSEIPVPSMDVQLSVFIFSIINAGFLLIFFVFKAFFFYQNSYQWLVQAYYIRE